MNDHIIYRGTGIQAAHSMIAWLKFALFQAKSSKTHFNRRAGVLPSQFKGKKVYSLSDHNSWWFLLLFDDIYDSMIIMILFIMDIILNI